MQKIAIVILNYLNYQDTIECVESIRKMNYDIAGMVIVDNASPNESYSVLKQRYQTERNTYIVRANKNYGYAKGNNIGIHIARKRFKTDFVYVVNNDVVFVKEDYFTKLLEVYDDKVGMIGSKILLNNEKVQKEFAMYVTFKEVINVYRGLWLKSSDRYYCLDKLPKNDPLKKKKVLHGCGLLFTPNYFKFYDGFYPRTFLYAEEMILYLMCQKYQLKQVYVEGTYIYHKENQASAMSYDNDKHVRNQYMFKSYKYAVWWAFKSLFYK